MCESSSTGEFYVNTQKHATSTGAPVGPTQPAPQQAQQQLCAELSSASCAVQATIKWM